MNPLIQLIISEVPNIIQLIQQRHVANSPDTPVPTAQEIMDNFEAAFASTILKDQLIRAALAAQV